MPAPPRHTDAAAAVTDLIIEVFRLNGRLLLAGDRLMAPLGLTSARWQVLGAIAMAERPEPVARLARTMGLTRQGVQRIVNELAAEGLVVHLDNPHHARSRLVGLSDAGKAAYRAAGSIQVPWANTLAEGLAAPDVAAAARVLAALRARMAGDAADAGAAPA